MKKYALVFLLLFAATAQAQGIRHEWRHGGYYRGGNDWLAPALIGGVIGYELSRPAPPPVVYSPPVIMQPPVVYNPAPAPYGYHYINILDANCNCYRLVLTPN